MKTKQQRILMLLENESFPEDVRVLLEAESLADAGYDVTVICPTGQSQKWVDTVGATHVYRYPKPYEIAGFFGYLWEYGYSLTCQFFVSLYVLVFRGFDVVHVHAPPDMGALIAIFYQLLGKRFVFDHHDLSPELYLARRGRDDPNAVYWALRYFERLACQRADRLIATNLTQQRTQIERCGADADHCYVVRNGPNAFFLTDVAPRSELRQPGRLVLGYVGVIGIQDGVDYMIRAVHAIKTVHGRDDFVAVIVGGGPAVNALQLLAQELDVSDLIVFTGMIPFSSVASYIASFDICLTPDPSNPYNDSCTTIKTLEYMALRKPTVCFRTLENERTAGNAALYADHNDVGEFARATVGLMDDPAGRESMGQIARARIEAGLTWSHQAVQLIALYDELFHIPQRGNAGLVHRDEACAVDEPTIQQTVEA